MYLDVSYGILQSVSLQEDASPSFVKSDPGASA